MSFEDVLRWLGLVSLILSLVNLAWSMLQRGTKDYITKQRAHDQKLTDHDRRIQRVENDIAHLPTRDQLHMVELTLKGLEGSFGQLATQMESMSHSVRRIDEYLRETPA